MADTTHYAELAGSMATEAATVADLAIEAATPTPLDRTQKYSVIVPQGATAEILDLERHLPEPDRTRGTYKPATVAALTKHLERHFDEKHSTIWVHPTSGRIVAVLNDAANDGATGWRDHRSQLDLQHTPEWMFWTAASGRLMPQIEFAEHIEDGVKEIVEPPAADMLELAQSFHATQAGQFRSAHRLQDGTVQVQYDESVEASAGRHQEIPIPTEFTLAIAPFFGEEPYKVTARLRYRLSGGSLRLGYRLERPEDVVRETLEHIAGRLTDQFTHVFVGEPAA